MYLYYIRGPPARHNKFCSQNAKRGAACTALPSTVRVRGRVGYCAGFIIRVGVWKHAPKVRILPDPPYGNIRSE